MKKVLCLLIMTSQICIAQTAPEFLHNYQSKWVDSVFSTLSLDQKIGQLLMPRGNYSGNGYEPEKLKAWVRDYHIGGVAMFAGQPTVQARIINEIQSISKVPLLVGMDFEWGLAMRLDSTVRFPYQMTLGAMQKNEALIERMGAEIGRQCRRMGVHVNYAPVVDVNINPNNPVINFRSFGENPQDVTVKSLAYMKGMQSQHILATAKHFPGHGDTGVDSHYDLPLIMHDKKRLNEVELAPYKSLIANGLSGIMTAHLSIPALDKTPNLASTLSSKIVTDLLRKELKFEGLVFTDAMDMQGAVKYYPNGEALVKAILAGNDILETFEDVPTAFNAIKKAIETKKLSLEILDARVKKILMAKSWVGLDQYKPIEIKNLIEDLNSIEADYLNRELAEKTLVLVKNEDEILPIKNLQQKTAFVSIGSAATTAFQKMAANYTEVEFFNLPETPSSNLIELIHNRLHDFELVVIGLHLQSIRPGSNYGLNTSNKFALQALIENENTVLAIFGNPYCLDKISGLEGVKGIIMANQLTDYMEEAATQAIFGGIAFQGQLPVTVNEQFKYLTGIKPAKLDRLSYGSPEQVGVNSKELGQRIDKVIQLGLDQRAYPGAVIEVAKNGRVIYQKSYGFHTYEDARKGEIQKAMANFEKGNKVVMDNHNPFEPNAQIPAPQIIGNKEAQNKIGSVQLTDLYDMASVTKVSTSALAVMQLMSDGKFSLDKTFGDYVPETIGTDKAGLKFRDMLTHRSGLKAWIPFWMDCVDTLGTINKALIKNPTWIEEFDYIVPEKLSFFKRIFRKKPEPKIDYIGSVKNKPELWKKINTPQNISWKPGIFSKFETPKYNVQITDSLWMADTYMNTVFGQIKDSPLKPEQGYVYSDMHYYFYPKMIKNLTGTEWETYLKKTYKSLGANSLTYNPRRFFDLREIVPTEYDPLFRKTQIHGRVHDEGAAMLGGVSGHAGLFGNANDLTKLMQMYLQNGKYGGVQFIQPEVLAECTKYQFDPNENRRAIAFDKLHPDKNLANGPQEASKLSYGHSGYTGTFTWIDPQYDLVYVFLSNRVYPTRDNNKISDLNIRTEVGNEIIRVIKGQ